MKHGKKIDISGINKHNLLYNLWRNSKNVSFFIFKKVDSAQYDENAARKCLQNGYIDYCCGRVIKANLSGDFACPLRYDRRNGEGAFQAVVNQLMSAA